MGRWVPSGVLTFVAFAVSSSAAPRFASACSCDDRRVVSPRYDDSDLPLDGPIVLRLLWDAYEPVTAELSDSSGSQIELEESETGFPGMWGEQGKLLFFKPTSPLVEGQSYRFRVSSEFFGPDEPLLIEEDEFVAVAPSPPPAPPVIGDVSYTLEEELGSCGTSSFAGLTLDMIPASGIVLVDRDGNARLEPESLSGSVSAWGTAVGTEYCNDNWRGAGYGASATVRVATIDDSGRFSGWSDDVRLKFRRIQTPAARAGFARPEHPNGTARSQRSSPCSPALGFGASVAAGRQTAPT